MNQVNGFDTHTTESDGDLKGSCETVSSFVSKDKASVCYSLFALECFLISNIDNISWSDIGEDELFFSEGFLFLFFLDYCFNKLSWSHGFSHGWNYHGEQYVWIVPLCLTWFSSFMIESGSWDPVFIKRSFIEWWATGLVSDDDVVFQLKCKGSVESVVNEVC